MILREPTHTCVPLGIILLWSARARAPPDHYYRDLGILHSRCDQLSLALAESCSGGRSPVIASPRVSPPSDALCLPRPDSSSLKIVIVQETLPAILLIAVVFQRSAVTNHSFLAPDIATIGDSVQGGPLLLTSGSLLQAIANVFASEDLACHPGLVLPLKIVIVQATPPAILFLQSHFQGALSRTIRSWRPILRQ